MVGELLTETDPLLPGLRKTALKHPEAHRWLLDSSRRWALREFWRRTQRREHYDMPLDVDDVALDHRMCQLWRHQCALLVDYQPSVGRPSAERVLVGFLCEQSDSRYVKMQVHEGQPISGLHTVEDIFELPEHWRVARWPYRVL